MADQIDPKIAKKIMRHHDLAMAGIRRAYQAGPGKTRERAFEQAERNERKLAELLGLPTSS